MKQAKIKHKHIKIVNPKFWQILNESQIKDARDRFYKAVRRYDQLLKLNELERIKNGQDRSWY